MSDYYFNAKRANFKLYQSADDDVRFVLDQYVELDFYTDSPLKQHVRKVDMSLCAYMLLIPIQLVFALTP